MEWKQYDTEAFKKKKKETRPHDIPKEVTRNYIPSCDNINTVIHDYIPSKLEVVILTVL